MAVVLGNAKPYWPTVELNFTKNAPDHEKLVNLSAASLMETTL
jgi:hypothetical protein